MTAAEPGAQPVPLALIGGFAGGAASAVIGLIVALGLVVLGLLAERFLARRVAAWGYAERDDDLMWRAFGWCRLEVDVAGPRQRRENRSESRRLRALIPVGTRADAGRMLSEVVSAPPEPSERPPRHARWKAPLMYHFLAWGGDDRYVVAA